MDVFAALADPVRRDLLLRLAGGPARVVDLASAHPISRPAISRHLRALGSAGLVVADDVGRERHYRLDRAGLAPVTALLGRLAPAPPFGEHALDGLELEVRRTGRERRAAEGRQDADDPPRTADAPRTTEPQHTAEETA